MKSPMKIRKLNGRGFALIGILLICAQAVLAIAADEIVVDDTFERDHSNQYRFESGEWAFSAEGSGLSMKKALESNNETTIAMRESVNTPSAFAFEADYTANDKNTSAGLILNDPASGDRVTATLTIEHTADDEIWVSVWFVYSYPDEKWGYIERVAKKVPALHEKTFHLVFTRLPGTEELTFSAGNSDIGVIETTLNLQSMDKEGKSLTPAWTDSLNNMTEFGLSGYDSTGVWSNIKMTATKE